MSSNTSKDGMADKTQAEANTGTNIAEGQETTIDNPTISEEQDVEDEKAAIIGSSTAAIGRAIQDIGATQDTVTTQDTATTQDTGATQGTGAVVESSSAHISAAPQDTAAVASGSNIAASNEAPPQDANAIADDLTATPAKTVNKRPKTPEEKKQWYDRRKELSKANADKKKNKDIVTVAMQNAFADFTALRVQEPLAKVLDFAREHLALVEGVETVVEKLETLEAEWKAVNEEKFCELVALLERSGVIPLGSSDL